MFKKTKFIPALLLTVVAGSITLPALAAEKCPIDQRKSRAVSERVGKKVQKAYELYSNEQVDEALGVLLEIKTSSDFDKAYVSRMIGSLYAGKDGKVDTAMKHLKVAVDINQLGGSDHGNAIKLLADLSISERKFDDALKYYQDWMTFTCKEDVNVYLRMASAHYEKKEYKPAISFADKSIALQKRVNKAPYSLKMGAYYETKQYKNAAKIAEEIVRLFPQEGRAWVQLAQMYMLGEDYKKSLYTMDVAFRNGFLEKASEYKMLAQLYAQNEVPLKSAQLQEQYLKDGLVERDVGAVSMLANTYHQAKQIDKAVKFYGEAGELSGNSKHYMRQAGLLMERERYGEAKTAVRKALDGTGLKSTGEAQMILAQAHFYLDEFKSAYKACMAATKDSKTAKNAKSWLSYIEDTAKRKKVSVR
ncbi:tetratricopeptide repeat protein [Ferrimonas lipolytica]|uniref:Tetratricopeptide repeat protein n=1 Tax=Ferrimonas lipolytica TaxID=2724191 RepID=A0A6H1UDK4_9GAMM|nr:tetratricopeptide repeat protein [Ferrimonas lipolytica]QIZ77187.1 tetratricopeptide repeat protein [Ferrimonas lipolytica]